ncbi:hypothetical protein HDV02_005907, partial [Globomyces sp. JEL0801]
SGGTLSASIMEPAITYSEWILTGLSIRDVFDARWRLSISPKCKPLRPDDFDITPNEDKITIKGRLASSIVSLLIVRGYDPNKATLVEFEMDHGSLSFYIRTGVQSDIFGPSG